MKLIILILTVYIIAANGFFIDHENILMTIAVLFAIELVFSFVRLAYSIMKLQGGEK